MKRNHLTEEVGWFNAYERREYAMTDPITVREKLAGVIGEWVSLNTAWSPGGMADAILAAGFVLPSIAAPMSDEAEVDNTLRQGADYAPLPPAQSAVEEARVREKIAEHLEQEAPTADRDDILNDWDMGYQEGFKAAIRAIRAGGGR